MTDTPDPNKQKPRSVMLDDKTWDRLEEIAREELSTSSRSQAIRYITEKHKKPEKRGGLQ